MNRDETEESAKLERLVQDESVRNIFQQELMHQVTTAPNTTEEANNNMEDDNNDEGSSPDGHLKLTRSSWTSNGDNISTASSNYSSKDKRKNKLRRSSGSKKVRKTLMDKLQSLNQSQSTTVDATASSSSNNMKKGSHHGRVSSQTLDDLDRSVHGLVELQEKLTIFGKDGDDSDDHVSRYGGEEDLDDKERGFKLGDPLHCLDEDLFYYGGVRSWWAQARDRCGALVNSRPIQWLVTALIIVNAILLGVMTFYLNEEDGQVMSVLNKLDLSLLICFTVELCLQLFYLGPRRLFKFGWLVFDVIIIVFSWSFRKGDIQILRSFRIFRAFALISRWGSLRSLVTALTRTLPNMANITIGLALIMYVFCVLFTSLYHDLYDEGTLDYDYFGRLDKTFLTLFQFLTLDSWTGVVRQVLEDRPAAIFGFLIFVIITAFFFLNLVVAVICESLIELNRIKEQKNQRKMIKQQRNLMEQQTQQLLTETHEVVLLQKKMLANQLAMQKLLMELVRQQMEEELEHTGGNKGGGKLDIGGKGSLLRCLSELESTKEKVLE